MHVLVMAGTMFCKAKYACNQQGSLGVCFVPYQPDQNHGSDMEQKTKMQKSLQIH